jgi:predicted metalloprotease with PDZ domain
VLYEGGAAQKAGLASGDRIIAIDGLQVDNDRVHAAVERLAPGDSVRLHAFRRDELMEFSLTAVLAEASTCELWLADDDTIDADTLARRKAWLRLDD